MGILNLYDIMQKILLEQVDRNSVENAIRNKNVVMITYNDEKENPPLGKRWIYPCALVDMNGQGKLAIRAYAYNGASRRGEIPDWRLFRLDRIQSWNPTNSRFTKAPDNRYNENGDKQYQVLLQVHFDDQDNMINRNINLSNQQNIKQNKDYFGRKINKTQQVTVPQTQQGPVNPNAQAQSVNLPSKYPSPKYNKQTAFKYAQNLKYKQNKRNQDKYNANLKKNFGNDEEEMMNKFDKEKFFDK